MYFGFLSRQGRIYLILFIFLSNTYLIFDFICLMSSLASTRGISRYACTYIQQYTHTHTHIHTRTQKSRKGRKEKKKKKRVGGVMEERKEKEKDTKNNRREKKSQ